ncbi:MAG: hypothetical protein FWG92_06105, partial [Leptospirales bacterium]|nr:hypothetical protein [Leptospirales bacterium]
RLRQNEGDVSRFHVHEVFNIDDIKTGNTRHPAGTQAKNSKVRPHRGITRFFEVIESILTVK